MVAKDGGAPVKSLVRGVFLLAALSAISRAQHGNWPSPPQAADKSSASMISNSPKPAVARVDYEREAKEILELSQSLQSDVQRVNQGILPKETIERLKRIEKLSKHLRSELGQ